MNYTKREREGFEEIEENLFEKMDEEFDTERNAGDKCSSCNIRN